VKVCFFYFPLCFSQWEEEGERRGGGVTVTVIIIIIYYYYVSCQLLGDVVVETTAFIAFDGAGLDFANVGSWKGVSFARRLHNLFVPIHIWHWQSFF